VTDIVEKKRRRGHPRRRYRQFAVAQRGLVQYWPPGDWHHCLPRGRSCV